MMKRPKLIPQHKALAQGTILTLTIIQGSSYIGQCYAIGAKSYLLYLGFGVLRPVLVGIVTIGLVWGWIKITLDYVKKGG